MAVYIDSSGRLHHDQESGIALHCPHCQVLAQVLLASSTTLALYSHGKFASPHALQKSQASCESVGQAGSRMPQPQSHAPSL